MVLMGYDASVFNSVQVSPNWLEYFDHPVRDPALNHIIPDS